MGCDLYLFVKRLRESIHRDGRTPASICRDAEIKPYVLREYLEGRRTPQYDTVCRLAAALGVSAHWLAGWADIKKSAATLDSAKP